jgi:hypothetical protein
MISGVYMSDIKCKRVLITFTSEQWAIVESLKGELGKGDSEVVRNIVLAWLSEKSFITDSAKRRIIERDENGRR